MYFLHIDLFYLKIIKSFGYIFVCRYIELLYPFWHKVHFKMKYIYIAIALSWIIGLVHNAAYMIPTGKVSIPFVHFRLPNSFYYIVMTFQEEVKDENVWSTFAFTFDHFNDLQSHFPYRQTDRQTDRQTYTYCRNKACRSIFISSLASRWEMLRIRVMAE